ncbi:hypothetical protein P7F60_06245 [Rhizobium sp. YJ-22]|uniref:hypothetical protein n=1 Tax=Rhizobium sp. YJ-22 TaxID=3037556 RepID=UPI00241242E9|nr:hypothetical protein [Rhizobium sp. YJ-22]MDG3575976.1 hypothetical protein [Rhizobium sp. YJ-22]
MEKIDFIVTEKAGLWVAGRRSPGAGSALPLTEEEAVYALDAGELRRPDAKPEVAKKPSKPAEA